MTWWKYLPQRNLQRVSKRHPLSSESLLTSPPMFAWHWLFWLILVPHIPLLIWCLSKTLFPSRTFSYHSWCFFPWGCKIGLLDILIKKILLMDSNILMYGLSVLSRNVLEHIFIFNSQRRFESMREREPSSSHQAGNWWFHPHSGSQPLLSVWPFFSVVCGKSLVLSIEADDGNWEENLALNLKRGQKAKEIPCSVGS